MKILVTGGAGFIGSVTAKKLLDAGHQVTMVDSLERGNEWAIDSRAIFLKGDLLDEKFVQQVFSTTFEGVLHFAGYILMEESLKNPDLYLKNNILPIFHIIENMKLNGSNNLVFSSSAGVYGDARDNPIIENSKPQPINPYGETKFIIEKMLRWHNIKSVALRYFNAAGALPDASLGEAHKPESHLIPLAISKAVQGEEFTLFGTDYPTPDSTCIRDYIHVLDLAEAHILALKALWGNQNILPAYNVGSGKGYSNREVLAMIEKVCGKKIKIREVERRKEAAVLVADTGAIKKDLGFEPQYSDLKTIIETAYNWHMRRFAQEVK